MEMRKRTILEGFNKWQEVIFKDDTLFIYSFFGKREVTLVLLISIFRGFLKILEVKREDKDIDVNFWHSDRSISFRFEKAGLFERILITESSTFVDLREKVVIWEILGYFKNF